MRDAAIVEFADLELSTFSTFREIACPGIDRSGAQNVDRVLSHILSLLTLYATAAIYKILDSNVRDRDAFEEERTFFFWDYDPTVVVPTIVEEEIHFDRIAARLADAKDRALRMVARQHAPRRTARDDQHPFLTIARKAFATAARHGDGNQHCGYQYAHSQH